ncbi:MAG: hypothetical protein ACI4RM_06770 [Ruminococcus sp.]
MNRFILVEPGGDITKMMMSDLEHLDNLEIFFQPYIIKSDLLNKLRQKHLGYKLNKSRVAPFQRIWRRFYTLNKYDFNKSDDYYIIFGNAVLSMTDDGFIRKLNSKPNVHLILYFSDPVDSDFAKLAKVRANRNKFKYIFTFDPEDAKKYGYILTRSIYSASDIEPDTSKKSDICFIGENKGRQQKLEAICDGCEKNNVKYNFRMTRVQDTEQNKSGIIYNERVSYLQTIAEAKASNCLLEIIQKGQSGVSFRYYEAVCYNKKLLTNNPEITKLPYYNPEFMKYYKSPEDIDFNWVKENIPVDYNYQGDFSPVKFMNTIFELIDKDTK